MSSEMLMTNSEHFKFLQTEFWDTRKTIQHASTFEMVRAVLRRSRRILEDSLSILRMTTALKPDVIL
jgi:hypothetical protein